MIRTGSPSAGSVAEATLFAFDDHGVPWRDNLHVAMAQAVRHPANPVLRCGSPGSPDGTHALIYGSVLEVDGRFRMWYLGMFEATWDHSTTGWWRPMCYAESDDGVHWTKPELGLVEFAGGGANNICRIVPEGSLLARVNDFLSVLHDPDEPDPERRYKAAYIAHIPREEYGGWTREVGLNERMICATVTAVSADGLTWRVVGERPCVDEKYEVSGLYRFGEFYYLTGQQARPWVWRADGGPAGRVMTTFRSPDFASWSPAKALGFARPGQLAEPPVAGQQTHMGAGIWNRGNVLLGLYGMWQDGPEEKPSGAPALFGTRVDLGLIVSHDGVHWHEPVPGHAVLPHGAEGQWDAIALTQGHAFAQIGEQTWFWYGHWDCEWQGRPQEIGLASLRRDGFGALMLHEPALPGRCVTEVMQADGPFALALNVAGVTAEQPLRVELLDHLDRPLPGLSGDQAAVVTREGVRRESVFPAGASLRLDQPFAVRVHWPAGSTAQVYALYLTA